VAVAAVDQVVLHVVPVVELHRLRDRLLLPRAVRRAPVQHGGADGAGGAGDEDHEDEAEEAVGSRREQCTHRVALTPRADVDDPLHDPGAHAGA
jgi:hypothetical protein